MLNNESMDLKKDTTYLKIFQIKNVYQSLKF